MAKVSYVSVPEPLRALFGKALNPGDRFTYSRLRRGRLFPSRKRKKELTAKNLLPTIIALWNSFDQTTKDAWTAAGTFQGLPGYKMFVQDHTLRLQNELGGIASPSTIYQAKVGNLKIQSPASHLIIAQYHPYQYWVLRAVRGKKGMREPVLVTESFGLPLTLRASYKANLTAVGPNPYARYYAKVYSHYQGRKIETTVTLELSLSANWQRVETTLNEVLGLERYYELYLELHDVQGDLFVDNLEARHSAQNWCRDPFCKDINQTFTKAFYQVPKHWAPVDIPEGAAFESIYYN